MFQKTNGNFFLQAILGILLSAVLVLVVFTLFFNSLIQQFLDISDKQRNDTLIKVVTLARNAIDPVVLEVRAGRLSREQGINQARALVRRLTYSDQYGPNYVFMSAYDGTMLVQPFEPDKEMTNQLQLRDNHGNFIIQKLIAMAQSPEGRGFVSYYYFPPQSDQAEEKRAFVIGIPELNCYIGTGMYMQQAQISQQYLLKRTRALSIGLILLLLVPIFLSIRQLYRHNHELTRQIRTREKAEAALRESEERYRELIETANVIVIKWDTSGFVRFINEYALEFFGFAEDEVLGKHLVGTIVPEIDSAGQNLAHLIREVGENTERFGVNENENITQDGRRVWVRWNNRALLDNSGQIQGILSIGSDITEKKRSEAALYESEARFRLLFTMAPIPLVYLSRDGSFLDVNQRLTLLFGYTLEDIPTFEKWNLLAYPDPHYREVAINAWNERSKQALETGTDIEMLEWQVVCKDGTKRTMLIGASVLGEDFIVSFLDITERKESEHERETLQAQLLQAQKMEAVGQLAGGVAHDFNNMLQAILGYLDLVQDEIEPGNHIEPYLEEIKNAAERSANLTRQLLAFARKQTVAPIVIDLNESVEGILKMLRRLIGEDIELEWLPDTGLWPIKMDPVQIDQILANLCVNARDAIDGVGRIIIETKMVTFDETYCGMHPGLIPGDYVLLAVSDNGCGMEKENLGKVFEPFFTTKSMGQGTGLGLATVYGIVKQNNGFIEVYSEPAHGTTFKIYLPRYTGLVVEIKQPGATETPKGHGETVLLVEDEATILKMTRIMLENMGYRVLSAGTPGEAIVLAAKHSGQINLLITDMIMPEMNGRDLAERLRITHPKMKCLFMSGYTANVIATQGVLEEGIHFLPKPFSIKALAIKVKETLA